MVKSLLSYKSYNPWDRIGGTEMAGKFKVHSNDLCFKNRPWRGYNDLLLSQRLNLELVQPMKQSFQRWYRRWLVHTFCLFWRALFSFNFLFDFFLDTGLFRFREVFLKGNQAFFISVKNLQKEFVFIWRKKRWRKRNKLSWSALVWSLLLLADKMSNDLIGKRVPLEDSDNSDKN